MSADKILLLASMLAVGCAGQVSEDGDVSEEALTKCASGATVRGVDVSGYQGSSIDWSQVRAAGLVFAFAKSSEGTGYIDSAFAHNWPAMRAAGVVRGAYHFFRPGQDGVAQADHMLAVIDAHGGLQPGDLSPVADVEVSDNQPAATVVYQLRRFLDRVQARTGRTPIIYTANFFWGSYLSNPTFGSGYPLWVANYGAACPYLPNAFTSWRFWQYSDHERVSGIPGGVDGDVFSGTLDELRAFAGASGGTGGAVGGDATWSSSKRLGRNADGRLELFGRGNDDAVWHLAQTAANGSWGTWASLGGKTGSSPVVSADADGRLEVFVIQGGHLLHTFQLPGGGWYQGWLDEGDGSLAGEPVAIRNVDGRLEVFARTSNAALAHKWQTSPNGPWSAWATLGGVLQSDPGVARNRDGRIEVFAVGADGELVHDWQVAPGSSWSGWGALGGITLRGAPHAGANADGRVEVFATGSDGRLHHIAQLPGGGWSAWLDAGGFTVQGEPAVAQNRDGRLEVFARGTDDQLWHVWQSVPNGAWTAGAAFGGTHLGSSPDAAPNADGRLQAFWRAPGGNVETLVELPGGGWSRVIDFQGDLPGF